MFRICKFIPRLVTPSNVLPTLPPCWPHAGKVVNLHATPRSQPGERPIIQELARALLP